MIRTQLRDKEVKKIAELINTSIETIYKLDSMGLIDIGRTIDVLIQNDWKTLRRSRYPSKQIVKALSEFYDCSVGKVESAIYNKKKPVFYCKECKSTITKSIFNKNNGVCDCCMNNQIRKLL